MALRLQCSVAHETTTMPNASHSVRLAACLAALGTTAWPTLAQATPCPDDARYADNGAGQAFCLFEGITLPAANDVAPYCHWLDYGYVGYQWTASAATASYSCPAGSYASTNGAGLDFCIFDDLDLPNAPELTPYCHWLEYGTIGYHWDICPQGARYTDNGAGLSFCLFEEVSLPKADDLTPYCDYIDKGYLGFHWSPNAATTDYECPAGARRTDNGAGLDFCLFEDVWLPPGEGLSAYCDYLDDGYFGYSWEP